MVARLTQGRPLRLLPLCGTFLAATLAVSEPASAQDTKPRQSGAAEPSGNSKCPQDIYRDAREYEEVGHFKQCGFWFLTAAESCLEYSDHADLLWRAAQCFRRAHLPSHELKAELQLVKEHPKTLLASRALDVIAGPYRDPIPLPYSGELAELYEDAVDNLPERPEAAAAAFLRPPLGTSEALEEYEGWVKRFRSDRPADAARASFRMAEIYDHDNQPARLRKHLEGYLAKWARFDDPDRRIRAHFRLGQLLWTLSCKTASDDGVAICPKHDARVALQAERHFQAATILWNDGAAQGQINGAEAEWRGTVAAQATVGAMFYMAENQRRRDERGGAARMKKLVAVYQRVADAGYAPWSVSSSARIGQLYAKDLRRDSTGPSIAKATAAFEACVAMATATNWHDQWSRLCEYGLNVIDPRRYPLASEITPQAVYHVSTSIHSLSRAPLVSEPE